LLAPKVGRVAKNKSKANGFGMAGTPLPNFP
jgi:hypothetical protein